MFAAAIKLRYSQPGKVRPYRVPGGKLGMWIISGVAFLTALFAIIVGFIPTPGVRAAGAEHVVLYVGFLFFGSLFFVAVPLVLYYIFERRKAAGSK